MTMDESSKSLKFTSTSSKSMKVLIDPAMLEFEAQQREELQAEQWAAQIAAAACEIPATAIKASIKNIIMARRKKLKTKYDYNAERKRDIHYNKHNEVATVEALSDHIAKFGKISYGLLSDPVPYVRNYKFNSFLTFQKLVDNHFSSFQALQILDFGGLLLGDDRVAEIVERIKRSPLHTLNLGSNAISDKGMESLATVLRSLKFIKCLILSDNDFSDAGVGFILGKDSFPPTLEFLNLSRNVLGNKSAYFIGNMFDKSTQSNLRALILGGKVGKLGWGDDFVRVLVASLLKPGARPLHQLGIADAGLTADGINALATFLICCNHIHWLNMSKNAITTDSTKQFFKLALCINSSLQDLFCGQCGLTKMEKMAFVQAKDVAYPLMWQERSFLGVFLEKELNAFIKARHKIELAVLNNWSEAAPLSCPNIMETLRSIPREDLSKMDNDKLVPTEIRDRLQDCSLLQKFVVFLNANISDCKGIMSDPDAQIVCVNEDEIQTSETFVAHWTKQRNSRQVILRSLVNRYIAYMNAGKKVAGLPVVQVAGSSWSKAKTKSVIDIESVLMSIEDFRSTQSHLVNAMEELIANMFRNIFASEGMRLQPIAMEEELYFPTMIPYYRQIGLPSLFTYYVYVFDPAEKERQRLLQMEDDRRMQVQVMTDARNAKRAAKPKPIIGRRFGIDKDGAAKDRDHNLYWGHGYGDILQSNDHTSAGGDILGVGQESKPGSPSPIKRRVAGAAIQLELLRLKNESERDATAAEDELRKLDEAAAAATDDAGSEGDSNGKKAGVVKEKKVYLPTRFLVAKREMQMRYNDLTVEELQDRTCDTNFSRDARRYAVGNYKEFKSSKGVSVIMEEELDRSEALTSINHINIVRPMIQLQERVILRKDRHRRERESDLL